MTPRATHRFQFHKGFTFADAEALVPYLAALGISHVYASPITTARAGSKHGYDVTDPTTVNPELGGEDALRRLVDALRREKMGLIADIVPNHMAATLENAWWVDVLREGRGSRYAGWFDIDWDCEDPELHGKVFLPWLEGPRRDADLDALGLPTPGAWYAGWWRTANDRINWRRFFDINDLVCLRMDDDEAFEAVHATIARLYAEGTIDGVRVDHIDGLADPAGYCHKLRQRLDAKNPSAPYLVVEKILLRGETLPADWGCDGTTGYDFMDEVSALQHDPAAQPVLAEAWATLTGRPADFATEEEAARREMLARSFAAPFEACVAAFDRLEQSDINRPALRRALTEMLVHFPVYRGYGTPADVTWLEQAAAGAKRTGLKGDDWVVDWLERRMLEPHRATTRFQQLSSPIAAKSVEDTAFYRHGPLISRNDVGFDTECFGFSAADFHARMERRQAELPRAMLTTATHDHKRGEDVRARLAVLSEDSQSWAEQQARWVAQAEAFRTAGMPSKADIVLLLQMIVGAWPLDLPLDDAAGRATFAEHLQEWQHKAMREAKLATDWSDPNEAYETAAHDLLRRIVVEKEGAALRAELFAFVQKIAPPGVINSLAQTLLRLTVPGMPDLYQGTELWDFSLVDPDNRRPVDYALREQLMGTATWRDGAIKQALIVEALGLRRALPDLFAHGSYEPVAVDGPLAEHVVAFLRRHDGEALLVVVPRLPTALTPESLTATTVTLPTGIKLFGVLKEDVLNGGHVALQQLWSGLPAALLSTRKPSRPFPQHDLPFT